MKKIFFALLFLVFSCQSFAQIKDTLVFTDTSNVKKINKVQHHFGVTLSIYNNIFYTSKNIEYVKSSPLQIGESLAIFYEISYKKHFNTEVGIRLYSSSKNLIGFNSDSIRYEVNINTGKMYDLYFFEKYFFSKPVKDAFIGFGLSYSQTDYFWGGSIFNHDKLLAYTSSDNNLNNHVTNFELIVGKQFKFKKKVVMDVRLIYKHPVYFQLNSPPRFNYTEGLPTSLSSLYGTQNITYGYDNIQFGISIKL